METQIYQITKQQLADAFNKWNKEYLKEIK